MIRVVAPFRFRIPLLWSSLYLFSSFIFSIDSRSILTSQDKYTLSNVTVFAHRNAKVEWTMFLYLIQYSTKGFKTVRFIIHPEARDCPSNSIFIKFRYCSYAMFGFPKVFVEIFWSILSLKISQVGTYMFSHLHIQFYHSFLFLSRSFVWEFILTSQILISCSDSFDVSKKQTEVKKPLAQHHCLCLLYLQLGTSGLLWLKMVEKICFCLHFDIQQQ